MSVAAADQSLYAIVNGVSPQTVGDVLHVMQQIDDLLTDGDGLKWFNRLYMMVTKEVDFSPPPEGWEDADWLLRLDVVFAGFYFRAMAGFLDGSGDTPNSWCALMEARYETGIDRILFALAGMNAHINHDLALALLETNHEMNLVPDEDSPQHMDYEAVNRLLNDVTPAALQMLAVGILGLAAEDTGKIGRVLAFWNICKARDLAWDFGDSLRALSGSALTATLAVQDQMTGVVGQAILRCV
ncbi:DUF5995 family protein [Edaphobacter dinghuensis]|uniref:Uncharacterized protein n=1 Tax=Edaphobacter dinghuensis TaxID=1560005 RepID=A0A917GZH1_9BACT|nr:DUF5995 family protein [Edaphobacter dinghuensis]GGG62678.1 hypothetical protein GCM10011585_00120 [Edaphobacter dinghuensis]